MKRIFALLFFITNSVFAQNVDSALIAYYPFTSNANDASGNGHNGIVYGNVVDTTDRDGIANSAYYFDGDRRSFVQIPNDTALMNFTTFAISLWFNKVDIVHYAAGLIDKQLYYSTACGTCYISPVIELHLEKNPTELVRLLRKTGTSSALGSTFPYTPVLNTWHHLVYCWGPDSVHTYLDNNLMTAYPAYMATLPDDTSTFRIGYGEGVGGYSGNWKGFIDEVRIYKRNLTTQDVAILYNSHTGINEVSNKQRQSIIYPNPNNGKYFFIREKELPIGNKTIQIYNNLGLQVKELKTSSNSLYIDLEPGIYTFKVITNNDFGNSRVEKVVVE